MRIGILGGGQLGRMLALAGYPLGLEFSFYEPNHECCVENLGTIFHASYQDESKLKAFAQNVDIITYESENIPYTAVQFLSQYKPVYPDVNIIKHCQNRLLEKNLFNELNVPTVNFFAISNLNNLKNAAEKLGFPFLLKTCTQGYDGKGQIKINNFAECDNLNLDHGLHYIAEEYIQFDREVSLIAVKNKTQTVFYDICENMHENGILKETVNKPDDAAFALAQTYVNRILDKFAYIGTFTMEFFQSGKNLIANEMAPRVHNSGHWTIEGAVINQFENHLRAILNWPLGSTQSIGQIKMLNMIGEIPNKVELLQQTNLHLHDYGKQAKPGRKLGHITIINHG